MKLNKLKPPVNALEALRESLPPAVAETTAKASRGRGVPLQLIVPPETLKALKVGAAELETTVRALVLEALQARGYPVPDGELGDRRRG